MATKSILKVVHLRGRKSAAALADALEHAKAKSEQQTAMSPSHSEASGEEIHKMFRNIR